MIVNFKVCEISRGACNLNRTSTIIKKIKNLRENYYNILFCDFLE